MNRRLWAWVEGEYHQTPHHGLDGVTPLKNGRNLIRYPHDDLDNPFLFEERRKVQKDRTVSLNGMVY
uniref:Uncharacterized protein n=1 Tax=Candidatus Kentrum sp. TUN TaxID=2126343 RepID=A0A451ABY0_9GAMM|nr:MAG: hypothetical protein BECKTUN1418F_GA0071002_13862 [Candidatus Kentron sp. TUN]